MFFTREGFLLDDRWVNFLFMKNYIATEAVIPLRSAPSESAEMVSQILFGEFMTGEQVEGNWIFVKNEEDGYEGWLTSYMITELAASRREKCQLVARHSLFLEEADGGKLYLPIGARIPVGDHWSDNGKLHLGNRHWQLPDHGLVLPNKEHDLLSRIQSLLNTSYLWGGRSSFGIDCSGLTQLAYRFCDILLPRDSGQQWGVGTPVEWSLRKAGDLAFFTKKNETKISHVGMLLQENEIIHASGRVRIDELTEKGILCKENNKLSHHLVGIRRYL